MDTLKKNHWYVYRKKEGEKVCADCATMADKPFLYTGSEVKLPLHPNCRCWLESYDQQMEARLKKAYPAIPRKKLDEWMQRGYYQYEQVALPVGSDGDYEYYRANGKLYRVNPKTLNGLGQLPDGNM